MLFLLSLFTSIVIQTNPKIGELAWQGQLRALVEHPQSSCFFGIEFNSDRRYRYALGLPTGPKPRDAQVEMAKLFEADLDYRTLSELAGYIEQSGEAANALACERMAHYLCKQHLRRQPDDVDAMFAMAHLLSRSQSINEAEKWLRLAVSTRPRDYRCWERLGWHYLSRVYATLLFPDAAPDKPIRISSFDISTITMTVARRIPEVEARHRRRAAEFCAKASDAFDWCVLFAPDSFEAHGQRFIVSQWLMPIAQILLGDEAADEKQAAALRMIRSDMWGEDLRRMAALSNDPRGYGLAILMDISKAMARSWSSSANSPLADPAVKKFYTEGRKRLRDWTQAPDAETSQHAWRMTALMEAVVFENSEAALAAFERVAFEPGDRIYYELAKFIYMFCEQSAEMEKFFARWIEATQDPIAYFDLANSLFHLAKPTEARTWLNRGLVRFPKNLDLCLAKASDLLARGEQRNLEEAPYWLTRSLDLHQQQHLLISLMGHAVVPGIGLLPPMPDREVHRFHTMTRLLSQCRAVDAALSGRNEAAAGHARDAYLVNPNDHGNALKILNWLETDAQKERLRTTPVNLDAPR